jgi:hypothetical protein
LWPMLNRTQWRARPIHRPHEGAGLAAACHDVCF